MKTDDTFVVTEQHLTLLRHMFVGWCDDEFGAPEIDPKRPYGNSDVLGDIFQLLGGRKAGFSVGVDFQTELFERLHRETQTALQIALATGEFAAGPYKKEQRYDDTSWRRVE